MTRHATSISSFSYSPARTGKTNPHPSNIHSFFFRYRIIPNSAKGHAIQNDLKALLLSHPRRLIRDTSLYRPLMQSAPRKGAMNPLARRGCVRRVPGKEAQMSPLAVLLRAETALTFLGIPRFDEKNALGEMRRACTYVARSIRVRSPFPGPVFRRSKKLRELAAAHLGLTIQDGAHSPAEDARAALLLYQRYAKVRFREEFVLAHFTRFLTHGSCCIACVFRTCVCD